MQTVKNLVDEIIITVRPYRMKRITGWGATCNACPGTFLSKNKLMARKDAIGHARTHHKGRGTIKEQ